MSTETTGVVDDKTPTEPVSVAEVEDKVQEELVADVTKLLEQPDSEVDSTVVDEATDSETPGEVKPPEEPPKGEGEEEVSDDTFTKELQTRAERAGISKELAEQFHQSGQLEDVIALSNRRMMEYVKANAPKDEPKAPPKAEPKVEDDQEVPALDPEEYDEALVKRDAYQQQRINALEAKLDALIDGTNDGFDEWFDGVVDNLGREDLFGKGTQVARSKQSNRDALFEAYHNACVMFGAKPNDRNKEVAVEAFKTEFREEIKKQVDKEEQKQTLSRARDSEGKFISTPKSKGGPPPKGATNEEVNSQLVSNVTSYLKEQGVQMSGY